MVRLRHLLHSALQTDDLQSLEQVIGTLLQERIDDWRRIGGHASHEVMQRSVAVSVYGSQQWRVAEGRGLRRRHDTNRNHEYRWVLSRKML